MLNNQFLSAGFSRLVALALAIGVAATFILFVSVPSQAAAITNLTVTSTGPLTAGQANQAPIVISFTAPSAMTASDNNSAYIWIAGAAGVGTPNGNSCTGVVTVQNDQGLTNNCSLFVSPNVSTQAMGNFGSSVSWPAGTTWTFTFDANTITLPYAATVTVNASTFVASSPPINIDSAQLAVSLTGYVAPTKTVTFNSNSGEGTMANQVASAATALTASSFTRSGYTFNGWNTLADGTGTAFADSASFPFTADQTLYAQWAALPAVPAAVTESALAMTGSSDEPASLLSSSATLISFGLVLLLLVQLRIRSQSYLYSINNLSNSAWRNYLRSGGRN